MIDFRNLIVVDAGRAANGAAAITWSVPVDWDITILQITIPIQTSAVAGNRYWLVRALGQSGSPDLAAIGTSTAHAANTTTIHVWHAGHAGSGSIGGYQSHPFPVGGLIVPRGGQFRWSPGASNDAGDLVGPLTFSYARLL